MSSGGRLAAWWGMCLKMLTSWHVRANEHYIAEVVLDSSSVWHALAGHANPYRRLSSKGMVRPLQRLPRLHVWTVARYLKSFDEGSVRKSFGGHDDTLRVIAAAQRLHTEESELSSAWSRSDSLNVAALSRATPDLRRRPFQRVGLPFQLCRWAACGTAC